MRRPRRGSLPPGSKRPDLDPMPGAETARRHFGEGFEESQPRGGVGAEPDPCGPGGEDLEARLSNGAEERPAREDPDVPVHPEVAPAGTEKPERPGVGGERERLKEAAFAQDPRCLAQARARIEEVFEDRVQKDHVERARRERKAFRIADGD